MEFVPFGPSGHHIGQKSIILQRWFYHKAHSVTPWAVELHPEIPVANQTARSSIYREADG
jgi:hypothetical protein